MPKGVYIRTEKMKKNRKLHMENLRKMNLGNKYSLGHKHKEESKEKQRQFRLGKKDSEEIRRKKSLAQMGKVRSEETKKKNRQIMLGKKNALGRKHSEIANRKLSDRMKGNNYGSGNKGKKISEEQKKKQSEFMKGRKHSLGYKHSKEWKERHSYRMKGNKYSNGENHPNFQNWKSLEPYGVDFNKEKKEYIRNRDHRICQCCQTKENGRLHCVHHIDGNKQNNSKWNLITLCLVCHAKTFNKSRIEYWCEFYTMKMKEIKKKIIEVIKGQKIKL